MAEDQKETSGSPRAARPADAWNALAMVGGMIPGVSTVAHGVARSVVQRLMGYWLMWHLYGGIDGLISSGVMSSATAYRQKAEFLRVFGVEVEEFGGTLAVQVAAAGRGGRGQ